MTKLRVGHGGEISLPDDVRDRYGFAPDIAVRVIETRSGVLLVPLTDAPMSAGLAYELADWQSLGTQAWEMFPYSSDDE